MRGVGVRRRRLNRGLRSLAGDEQDFENEGGGEPVT